MQVYIINQELRHAKRYQIMTKCGTGFNHVFPGKLFTLEEAEHICDQNGYTVIMTGNMWQCI